MAEAGKPTEEVEDEEKASGGKMKLIIIAVVALVLLAGGGGAAAFFLGVFDSEPDMAEADGAHEEDGETKDKDDDHGADQDGDHGKKEGEAEDHDNSGDGADYQSVVYVDLPDVLVNLQSESRRSRFLKLKLALEVLDAENADTVKNLVPKILDSFQLYLRALTAEEVKGSSGMQRLKAEMLARINNAIAPIRISDLLFKEMLVQ